MANPLYPGNNYPQYPQYQQSQNNPVSNFSDLLNNFNNFKMGFQGNPEAQVKELLRSGRMTPEQFQQYSNLAKMFSKVIR